MLWLLLIRVEVKSINWTTSCTCIFFIFKHVLKPDTDSSYITFLRFHTAPFGPTVGFIQHFSHMLNFSPRPLNSLWCVKWAEFPSILLRVWIHCGTRMFISWVSLIWTCRMIELSQIQTVKNRNMILKIERNCFSTTLDLQPYVTLYTWWSWI